jgi:hypothetical protein
MLFFKNNILKIKFKKKTTGKKKKIIKATKEFKSMFQKSIAILRFAMLCNELGPTGMEIGAMLSGKDIYIYIIFPSVDVEISKLRNGFYQI